MKLLRQFIRMQIYFVLITIAFASVASAKNDLNLLARRYPLDRLKKIILPKNEWHPYPTVYDRDVWLTVPANVRDAHIARGEELLNYQWKSFPATVFLEFVRTGNRTNYERLTFLRRRYLADLVMAEIFENKGRFIDQIVNGIWAICEESYWGVPAHLFLQKAGPGLPDVTEPTVDLFAAETANLLSWTSYLLCDELDKVSPTIQKRIHYEIDRRILTPNFQRDDFWWMGFQSVPVNNWNPWINSNWLAAVLLSEQDSTRRIASIYKIMRSLDVFINSYPDDGGCDEGPSYWKRAAASLLDCLGLLHSASDGKIDIFDEPIIREMGKYIIRAHISGEYFVNFADAKAKINIDPILIYRYGKRINDESMIKFAAFYANLKKFGDGYLPGEFGVMNRLLPSFFLLKEFKQIEPEAPLLRDVWLPQSQIMAARTASGSKKGLYLAAKGGHNDESHNHNDVGNFIIYADGNPVIIDVGVAVYTAKTFSEQRYDIWNIQSAYHNLPTINGIMQMNGRKYAAKNVLYQADGNQVRFTLDIADAYPDSAQVLKWLRQITFNRNKNIIVQENYQLKQLLRPFTLNLMTTLKPELIRPGIIKLTPFTARSIHLLTEFYIEYDKNLLDFNFEIIKLTDVRLKAAWQNQIVRILLTSRNKSNQGQIKITFHE